MTCQDASLLKRFVEKCRIYEFFASLNIEFDAMKVQILGKEDFPSLNETLAIVYVEEGRRGIMLETPTVENSAQMTRNVPMQHSSIEHQGRLKELQMGLLVKQGSIMVYIL